MIYSCFCVIQPAETDDDAYNHFSKLSILASENVSPESYVAGAVFETNDIEKVNEDFSKFLNNLVKRSLGNVSNY